MAQTKPPSDTTQSPAATAPRLAHKRIVVKIGSALLANTTRLTPRFGFIQRLMEDIARLRSDGYEVILCSSGSVALGMR